jgi:hypothetical protein
MKRALVCWIGGTVERDCPTLEILAALVDNNLMPEERDQVEAHLTECDICLDIVAFVMKHKPLGDDQASSFVTNDDDTLPESSFVSLPVKKNFK